ncbi:1-(5-phosphoribosyl)-5-[(5-phosphoribosylamino)methylideneamino] imidazole-4-carboxamide isomerase, chloroplastic-like isoform X6 [Asparagus officinalis]|uniref:1-(5-phosphoribosyl)-5-[(5- phosphoribosylamino)methylideneamino] imidazole-4-carboxamide isomerase, chloroplastic-like isoform X6 n=1 Tax=Asparagus officinalis TaxID=4686 RepID=UPI00098E06F6|nr:1-(5-phosphoribosyl)-5-[(5-phosphoribosylamino)methylideneamino] imidazole-4-carboxamide isomerase, chloroplastic-like isoform X6 [Asparagus officinalis]
MCFNSSQVSISSFPSYVGSSHSRYFVQGLRSASKISLTSFPQIKHKKNQWAPPVWTSSSCSSSQFVRLVVKCGVRFRPCIDIHEGKVKQIVGSTLQDSAEGTLVTNFESDKSPAEYATLYKKDELAGGHVIMLGADAASKCAAIEALHAYPGGMQVGGGINVDNAQSYIEEGASHVIVTSNSRYFIVTDRWQKFSDVILDKTSLTFLATFADEFLVHGVDVEGKRLGIDERLVTLLGRYSPIPVTYAGGVNSMADMERIKKAGKGNVDVTVGSALDIFGGDLSYKEVVSWHKEQKSARQ